MVPSDIQPIGNELAIKWEDGSESYIPFEKLRRACPCAACKGEGDIMGRVARGPEQKLSADSFALASLHQVGGYAVQPVWRDGHASGIYPYPYLKKLGDAE